MQSPVQGNLQFSKLQSVPHQLQRENYGGFTKVSISENSGYARGTSQQWKGRKRKQGRGRGSIGRRDRRRVY